MPLTPSPITGDIQVNAFTSNPQYFSSVAALEGGDFVVTWTSTSQDSGGTWGVYGQRYDAAGNVVGSEFRINTFTSTDQAFSSVAGLEGGDFVVTWSSNGQDGSSWGIYGQRYDAAGLPVGGEFPINTFTSGIQIHSSVAALGGGGFVVTWTSDGQDGSGDGVYGQRYDDGGVAAGSEFRVNTLTAAGQLYSSVAALEDGGFVVTWTSVGQDGSNSGIFAQRFDATGN